MNYKTISDNLLLCSINPNSLDIKNEGKSINILSGLYKISNKDVYTCVYKTLEDFDLTSQIQIIPVHRFLKCMRDFYSFENLEQRIRTFVNQNNPTKVTDLEISSVAIMCRVQLIKAFKESVTKELESIVN